jgi:multiple sugar transport system ATP-binding protein
MTMGDRVALMRCGKLQQVAPPQIIYRDPVNLFVASFIGSPSMNFVRAEILAERRTSPWPAAPTSTSRCSQRTWRCVPI